MLGSGYDSLQEFKQACRENRTSLDPGKLLGKLYTIDQIRHIAERYDARFGKTGIFKKEMTRLGYGRRYEFAEAFGELVNVSHLGQLLSRVDHESYFEFLSYARLRDVKPYSSAANFVSELMDRGIRVEPKFTRFFNGLTKPPGRNCKFESIFLPQGEESVSLLFSCTRVLNVPDAEEKSLENYFLARVPVLTRIFFDRRIIEFSMPSFSESIAGEFGTSNRIPIRYQIIIQRVMLELMNLLGYPFDTIDFDLLSLYLEIEHEANDMGWKILPQYEAAFDLTQGVIPLRDIITGFSRELRKEIRTRDINHPLYDIDLYSVFRAIRERSYTYSLVLKVPYRKKKSHFLLSIVYGRQDSEYFPMVILSRNTSAISTLLLDSICDCKSAELENPYNLDKLLFS